MNTASDNEHCQEEHYVACSACGHPQHEDSVGVAQEDAVDGAFDDCEI